MKTGYKTRKLYILTLHFTICEGAIPTDRTPSPTRD